MKKKITKTTTALNTTTVALLVVHIIKRHKTSLHSRYHDAFISIMSIRLHFNIKINRNISSDVILVVVKTIIK